MSVGYKYRIRVAATDPHTGQATRWRVISGRGPNARNYGEFDTLTAAVAFVRGAQSTTPGATDEA